MEAHPAQPSNVKTAEDVDRVVKLLDESLSTLESTRLTFRSSRPTRAKKEAIRRHLAGVIGDLENIRWALK